MRIVYIMMAAALIATAADVPAGDAPPDPGGWSKAKWGMTEPQLAELFPDAKPRIAPDEAARKVLAARGLPIPRVTRVLDVPIELADAPCTATLAIGADGKLDHVVIVPDLQQSIDTFYQSLEKLLVEKYGRPWKTEEQHGVSSFQWSFRTTVIELQRIRIDASTAIVQLTYRHRPADLDKL